MTSVVDALAGRRIIVEFPVGLASWMAACEVLLQEGLSAWTFAADDVDTLRDAQRVFGRRARLGIRGVRTPAQAAAGVEWGVHFITATVSSRELLDAASGTPIALGALTFNEVQHALDLGASSVHLVPADAFGMAYARSLLEEFVGLEVIASGKFERWQADMWLGAGAGAICLAPGICFPDAASPDLVALRTRARSFVV